MVLLVLSILKENGRVSFFEMMNFLNGDFQLPTQRKIEFILVCQIVWKS